MDTFGLVARGITYCGIVDAYAFLRRIVTKSQVAVLMYHRVSPEQDNWSLPPVSPQSFERQMEYLSRNYTLLSLEQVGESVRTGDPLPEKAVAITFDDGYKDNYLYAYPLLQKYHVPATMFLTTGYIGGSQLFWWDKVGYVIHHTAVERVIIDGLGTYILASERAKKRAIFVIQEQLKKVPETQKERLIDKLLNVCEVEIPEDLGTKLILSWKEVKELAEDGVTFGAHSVNHFSLTNIPLEQALKEINQAKRDIEKRIGKEVRAFSYPNGDFNVELIELVRKSGFTCAVLMFPGKLVNLKDSVYQLNRLRAREDFYKFRVVLSGLWGALQVY